MPETTIFQYDKIQITDFAAKPVSIVVTVEVNSLLVPSQYNGTELRSNLSNNGWHVAFFKDRQTLNTAPATIVRVD